MYSTPFKMAMRERQNIPKIIILSFHKAKNVSPAIGRHITVTYLTRFPPLPTIYLCSKAVKIQRPFKLLVL